MLSLVFFGYLANSQTIAAGNASPSGYSKLSDALFFSHIVLDANLRELKGHYQLSGTEYDKVLFLAEQCVGDYGPAVYLARSLALENGMEHEKSEDCGSARNSLSETDQQFMIYPNPTDGVVTIENLEKADQVLVYNLLGELVYSESLENQAQLRLDLSDLQTGVYWIRTSNSLSGQKILIQR